MNSLIDHNANINIVDPEGLSAVHFAALNSNYNIKPITIINSKFEIEISSFRQREGDENVDKARGRRK